MKTQIEMNTERFYNYITKQGLSRWKIWIDENGVNAILLGSKVPNSKRFTQVIKQKEGTYLVRLSNKDYDNELITKGEL